LASSRRGRSGGGIVDAFGEYVFVNVAGVASMGRPSAIALSVSKRARAVGKRSLGAFARQRATTRSRSGCTFGFFAEGRGASFVAITIRSVFVVDATNGRSPVSIS
jgi:hypothetical protein